MEDKDGEIICNVENGSNIGGISTTGFHYPTGVGFTGGNKHHWVD